MDTVIMVGASLLAWRFLFCLAVGLVVGVPIGYLLGPVIGFPIVLVAVGFGIVWQGRYLSGIPLFASVKSTPISRPVAFLGLAFIGALCGGIATEAMGSIVGGVAVLLACVTLYGAWVTVVAKQHVQMGDLAFAAFSLLCGLGGLAILSTLRA